MRIPSMLALFVLALMLVAGCATTKTRAMRALTGTWNYTVYDTPEGDVDGALQLMLEDTALGGQISSRITSGPAALQDVRLEGQTLTFSATLYADGEVLPTSATATVNDNTMTGTMSVTGYGTFAFSATRAGS